jgi:transposase
MYAMDRATRREQMHKWIALGRREGLTFRELASRSGVSMKTLYRWNAVFTAKAPSRETRSASAPAPQRFVELVERAPPVSEGRIEILLAGERRVVVSGAVEEASLVNVLRALERC